MPEYITSEWSDWAEFQTLEAPAEVETYSFSGSAAPSGLLVEILDDGTVLASTLESGGAWSTSFDMDPEALPSSVTVRASASGFITEEQTAALNPEVNSYENIDFALAELAEGTEEPAKDRTFRPAETPVVLKDPEAQLLFGIDFSGHFSPGFQITDFSWQSEGLTLLRQGRIGDMIIAKISGGQPFEEYRLRATVTAESGEQKEIDIRTIKVLVQSR